MKILLTRPTLTLVALLSALQGEGCLDDPSPAPTGRKIGVYSGVGADSASVRASIEALRWGGFEWDTLTEADLVGGGINRCRAILVPGGDQRRYSDYFGPVGRQNIRQFVAAGGGYIGLGAGGGLAASDSIDWPGVGLIYAATLFPVNQIVPWPGYGLTPIVHSGDSETLTWGDRLNSLYFGGPEFFPLGASRDRVVYRYGVNGGVAAIRTEYGLGHVFAAGFQPEFEEGSMRDSVAFADNLYDPESDWDLIKAAARYCLQE